MNVTDEMRRAACQSVGTKQCAAICLTHSPWDYPCPAHREVWTREAVRKEKVRRPNGPLKDYSP